MRRRWSYRRSAPRGWRIFGIILACIASGILGYFTVRPLFLLLGLVN